MIGLGTIINTAAVLLGGGLGLLLKDRLRPALAQGLQKALGLATVMIGAAGALAGMLRPSENGLETAGSLLLVLSLVLGTLCGEWLKIESGLEHFGEWLKCKCRLRAGRFTEGFVTASLVTCVGAMAVVGALNDGLRADPSLLFVKSALDCVIVMVFAASLGVGALFSALPIALYQGGITLFAGWLRPLLTDALIADVSMVGSVLILAVGVNLVRSKTFRVGNMLPALLVPAVYAALQLLWK